MIMMDKLGRRNIIFIGCTIQAGGMLTMGGLGTTTDPSISIRTGIVACMIIMVFGFCVGWAPVSHVLSAELPSQRLRDITYRSASLVNIATQFTVAFTMPYLLNKPYAALGSRVGFIYGSIAVMSMVFVFFCVPECKGRTLEEIDLLFESKTPLRKFNKVRLEDTELHMSPAALKSDSVSETDRKQADTRVEAV
jgi:MFS transporter, SP family, sugar:H+ symporter